MICKTKRSDCFRLNNDIFITVTDENGKEKALLSAVQMQVLAVMYSLAPFKTNRVKVRQSVLAKKCGCSEITIRRAVAALYDKGYIVSMTRDDRYASDNTRLLGTYTYVLAPIKSKGFFYVSRKALELLDKVQTRVYLFICKCSRKTMDCWQSFSDIAAKLRLARNSVVNTIRELVAKQVIERVHNHSSDGSFNDNTYVLEDIELKNSGEAFIQAFFGEGSDGAENEITAEKEKRCREEITTAHKNIKIHTTISLSKSLHQKLPNVNSLNAVSSGFFYEKMEYP